MNYKEITFSLEHPSTSILPLKKFENQNLTFLKLENIFTDKIKNKLTIKKIEFENINLISKKINLKFNFTLPKKIKQKYFCKENILPKKINFIPQVKKYFNKIEFFKKKKIKFTFTITNPITFELIYLQSIFNASSSSEEEKVIFGELILNLANIKSYEREFLVLRERYNTKEVYDKDCWLVIVNRKFVVMKRGSEFQQKIYKKMKVCTVKDAGLCKVVEDLLN